MKAICIKENAGGYGNRFKVLKAYEIVYGNKLEDKGMLLRTTISHSETGTYYFYDYEIENQFIIIEDDK